MQLQKHSKITENIQKIEDTIATYKLKQNETDDPNEDALDSFMSTLNSSALNKVEIRKLKIDLINLKKEEMIIHK